MIKKIVLASAATLALIVLPVQASGHGGKKDKEGQQMHKAAKKSSSPFLIQKGLPHFTQLLMQQWDSKELALTEKQKAALLKVRKATLGGVKKLKPQIMMLEKKIKKAIKHGTKAETLQTEVEKLAKLRAEATMVHLRCIENTRSTLDKRQLKYLKGKAGKH